MARGRSRSKSRSSAKPVRSLTVSPLLDLSLVDDLRVFHPDRKDRPARTRLGLVPRVVIHSRPAVARSYMTGAVKGLQVPVGVKFHNPYNVITCVRRKVRRAVMFAKRKTGAGSRKPHRRRNWKSEVSCRS